MCHINLSNCCWSPRLHETFWGVCISDGEGGALSFRCLPFGCKYGPILCQKVLERLVEEIGLVEVLVLIYIDNVLIVGRGKGRVREQFMCGVQALRAAGGVIAQRAPWSRLRDWCGLGRTWTWVGAACGRHGMRGTPCWPISWDCMSVSAMCGVWSGFWGARNGSVGLILGIDPTCQGFGPMCYAPPTPTLPAVYRA